MNAYQPGNVYFGHFPKFIQIPDTQDYNIDSLKANAKPRPLAILQQLDQNRIIAAPITGDDARNHEIFSSYIPLRKNDYPQFLAKDSFLKTNQIQVFDISWLYPIRQPKLVGALSAIDLERAQYFSLYSTQTVDAYTKWVTEIINKNVPSFKAAGELKNIDFQVLTYPSLPPHRAREFNRGDIVISKFPGTVPPSSEKLVGEFPAVVLTDGNLGHIPTGQTIVIPLVPNISEYANFMSAFDTKVKSQGQVLRACVGQISPMNRDWMGERMGRLHPLEQLELDRGVITGLGMKKLVLDHSKSQIAKLLQNRSKGR